MTWFKVDDTLATHPKARAAGLAAMGLWAVSGAFASQHLTEGFVPRWYVETWPKGVRLASDLVRAELWSEAVCKGVSGWCFHQWDERNPTKDSVEEKRAADRERQRIWRENQKMSQRDKVTGHSVTNAVTDSVTNGVSHSMSHTPPDPTRPDPTHVVVPSGTTTTDEKTSSPAGAVDAEFEGFWAVYPRKVGKQAARKAYTQARKIASIEQMRRGLQVLIRAYDGQSLNYMPHPATWLNQGRWDDDADSIRPPVVDPKQQASNDLFARAYERAQQRDQENLRELES